MHAEGGRARGATRMNELRRQLMLDLEQAAAELTACVRSLPPQDFLASLGDWSPRDIVAHFIGWNRGILVGCAELREGVAPYYLQDGPNDYRTLNAGFIRRFSWRERETLLANLASSLTALTNFLTTVPEEEWEADSGVVHYRGGPATVSRCVESLMRDYRDHCQEILQARPL